MKIRITAEIYVGEECKSPDDVEGPILVALSNDDNWFVESILVEEIK